MPATLAPPIQKTPNVCGGDACVGTTRIPVWLLVQFRRGGVSDARLIEFYPQLTAADLAACWDYYRHNTNEIDRAIWYQSVAGNVPEGAKPLPDAVLAGLRLGASEAEVKAAFDTPLTDADVDAAWAAYWADPAAVERAIARQLTTS